MLSLLLAAAITAQNWLMHPAIREVRALVGAVNQAALRPITRVCDDGRELAASDTPVGARRRVTLGSGDSAATVTGTYDRRGVLRFVLVEAGAVNGTHAEYRYYFDARGQRLWLDRRQTGPGYPFSPADFEQRFGRGFSGLRREHC